MQNYVENTISDLWRGWAGFELDEEALDGLLHAGYHGGPEHADQHRFIQLVAYATRMDWRYITFVLECMAARQRGGRCISILQCLN